MPNLIRNALMTPDGTVLQSFSRHDYVTHVDANGKMYMVDGGLSYGRRSAHGDEVLMYLHDDAPHEVQAEVLTWGTYGKDGKQKFKRIAVKDMETSHIKAVLRECNPHGVYEACMQKELEYRKQKKKEANHDNQQHEPTT